MTITLRTASHDSATTKGSPLTHAELDANFTSFLDESGSSLVGFLQSGTLATADVDTVQGALRRAFGLLPGMNGITFFDTFSRADTGGGSLGTSESGHTWDLRGAYAGSYPLPAATGGNISDGKFVLNPATATVCYATYTFAEAVTRMGARISWEDNSGSGGSTFAMVSSLDNKFIDTMIHFTVTRSTWKLQVRVSGGSFVDLLTGSFSPTLAEDGTIYTVELILAGRTATVNVNGKVDSIYDSRIPTSLGKYAFWEIFYNNSTPEDKVRVHSVWAGCAPVEEFIGNARHIPGSGATEFQGVLAGVAGAINCVGTDSVQSTLTILPSSTATGGFSRPLLRLLNGAATHGWNVYNITDGGHILRFRSLVSGTETTRLDITAGGALRGLTTSNGPVGTVTLTANAASTTVSNTAVTASSLIFLMPTSASAAADQGSATGVYISALSAGTSFTVTHPNNANADKTFNYLILN